MRLVEHARVDPTRHLAGAGEPQRIVSVVAELRVMRAEARIDERVLHGLRLEHRYLTRRLLEREYLGRRMIRAFLAPRRVVPPAHGRGEPHAPLLVEHRVVVIGTRIPELLVAPVRRWLHGLDT